MSVGLSSSARSLVRRIARPVWREGLHLKVKASRKLYRLMTPIREPNLRSVLERLMPGGTDVLFVHSSLSACGGFTAGPLGVLNGLAEHCNTLCLPTHTYCYPKSDGVPGPVFDAQATPSQIGVLPELFRTQPGVIRSIHATHSLAASGTRAREICADHYRADAPCAVGTPYARLIQMRASVLMFGVNLLYYTLFHTAEFESESEFAYEHGMRDWLRVVDEKGAERDCWSRRQSRAPMRFAEAGDLLESAGLVTRATLGRGVLLYVPNSAKVHDFLLERLRTTPDFLRRSCVRELS